MDETDHRPRHRRSKPAPPSPPSPASALRQLAQELRAAVERSPARALVVRSHAVEVAADYLCAHARLLELANDVGELAAAAAAAAAGPPAARRPAAEPDVGEPGR